MCSVVGRDNFKSTQPACLPAWQQLKSTNETQSTTLQRLVKRSRQPTILCYTDKRHRWQNLIHLPSGYQVPLGSSLVYMKLFLFITKSKKLSWVREFTDQEAIGTRGCRLCTVLPDPCPARRGSGDIKFTVWMTKSTTCIQNDPDMKCKLWEASWEFHQ